jgi:hypothetical protein
MAYPGLCCLYWQHLRFLLWASIGGFPYPPWVIERKKVEVGEGLFKERILREDPWGVSPFLLDYIVVNVEGSNEVLSLRIECLSPQQR